MVRRSVFVLLLLLLSRPALAQGPALPPVDSARAVELRLSDSTLLTGHVVAEDLASLTLVTAAGARITVPLVSLARWRSLAEPPPPVVVERDPNDSRLFLAHTARSVPRGKGYVLDYLVFFPVVGVGITDRFSLTGGMSLIPFSPDQLFYVAPKLNLIESSAASLAAGVLYLRIVGFIPEAGYAGVAYGVTTFGGEKSSATVLVGFPFASGGWEQRPLIVLGGETRVSRRVKLLVEAWKLPGSDDVPAVGGVRLIGDRVSWDLGLLVLLGSNLPRGGFLPWVDVTLHW